MRAENCKPFDCLPVFFFFSYAKYYDCFIVYCYACMSPECLMDSISVIALSLIIEGKRVVRNTKEFT